MPDLAEMTAAAFAKRRLPARRRRKREGWGHPRGDTRVEQQLDDWPEKRERETKWFEARKAASLVDEGGLAEIIDRFSESYIRFVALHSSF
jgi:hypothetical protein